MVKHMARHKNPVPFVDGTPGTITGMFASRTGFSHRAPGATVLPPTAERGRLIKEATRTIASLAAMRDPAAFTVAAARDELRDSLANRARG